MKLCNFGIASSCQQHPIDGAHHCKDIQLSAENFTESIAAASEMLHTLTPYKTCCFTSSLAIYCYTAFVLLCIWIACVEPVAQQA